MTDLTKKDKTVLLEVATHPGTYASAISHRTGMDGRTVSRSAIHMEKKTLLTRTLYPQSHGRVAQQLTLTTTGRAAALLLFATTMTEASHAAD